MKRFAVCFAVLFVSCVSAAQEKLPPRVVRVTGTAEVKVVPDHAQIALGVETQNVNGTVAKQSADAAARQILATLRANGIDEKDVQTTFLSLRPQFTYGKQRKLSSFVARQSMTITVRDLTKVDVLLDALIKAGGNRIDSLTYEVSDMRKYRDQARDMAIKAAREKAAALAKAVGQDIGNAYSIDEVPEPTYRYNGLANAVATTNEFAQAGPSSAPGQNTVSASVVVMFDLK